jgi:hypothetical protein
VQRGNRVLRDVLWSVVRVSVCLFLCCARLLMLRISVCTGVSVLESMYGRVMVLGLLHALSSWRTRDHSSASSHSSACMRAGARGFWHV